MQNAANPKRETRKTLIRLGLCSAIGVILALGVFLRIEDLIAWRQQPQMAFYKGTPLLTTFDGYFYARYARELVEGNYKPLDELRYVPQTPARPYPPPLLSLFVAGIVKLTGASVDWVSTFFPAIFAVLLFFPVFLLGRLWGNTFTGLAAGLLSLCSPYYVNRSRLGWLDTDCGNVTFTMLAVYLAIRSVTSEGRRQQWYIAGVLVNFLLYLFWWDQTPYVVVATCLGTLVLSYVCETKLLRRNLFPVVAATLFVVVVMIFLNGASFWLDLVPHLLGHLKYISKATPGDFPNIGVSISEQVKISFEGVVQISAGNWFLFIAAALGTALLFLQSPLRGLQLLVPMGLGGLTFLYAKRFGIFLAPFLGLGIGHLLYWLKEQIAVRTPRLLWKSFYIAACFALPIGIAHLIVINMASTFWPVEPPHLIQGMDVAREKTPPGSVIWAWWDHGYPMLYFSRRGTISDGMYHDGELAMINAFPMATPDYQQSANWMQFYVARGFEGFHLVYKKLGGVAQGQDFIRRVLAAGPEKCLSLLEGNGLEPKERWLAFFFPPPQERRPLYLFLDERLVGTNYWWFWLGSWDVIERDGVHPQFTPFFQVRRSDKILTGNPPFTVHLDQGVFYAQKMTIPLAAIVFRDGDTWQAANYRDVGMIFQYDPSLGLGGLYSPELQDSIFNKLFFMQMADIRYFKPVHLAPGVFQIWEVLGETPTNVEGGLLPPK